MPKNRYFGIIKSKGGRKMYKIFLHNNTGKKILLRYFKAREKQHQFGTRIDEEVILSIVTGIFTHTPDQAREILIKSYKEPEKASRLLQNIERIQFLDPNQYTDV